MENLLKGISEYLPFTKGVIQRQMSYKIGFFMRTIGGLIQVLIMYYLWMAIFNSSPTGDINGFTFSFLFRGAYTNDIFPISSSRCT